MERRAAAGDGTCELMCWVMFQHTSAAAAAAVYPVQDDVSNMMSTGFSCPIVMLKCGCGSQLLATKYVHPAETDLYAS